MILFIEYPKCSTCVKAKKFIESFNVSFIDRNIVTNTPSYEEINKWYQDNNVELRKFFNTSGLVYKDLNLKDKMDSLSDDDKIKLLASNGMLIKRPLLLIDGKIYLGFKEDIWKKALEVIK